MEIEFTFLNDLESEYDFLENHFLMLSQRTFSLLQLENEIFILETTLCDPKKIHALNLRFRKVDRPTDVLSFAYEEEEKEVRNAPRILGEIFICVEKAKEQALLYQHSFMREISFLFVHGLLHLLGYDHQNKEEEKVMFDLQDKILDPLSL